MKLEKLKEDRQAELYDVALVDGLHYMESGRIIGVYHDIDDKIIYDNGITCKLYKVYYTIRENKPYFNLNGFRHHLENFIREDF